MLIFMMFLIPLSLLANHQEQETQKDLTNLLTNLLMGTGGVGTVFGLLRWVLSLYQSVKKSVEDVQTQLQYLVKSSVTYDAQTKQQTETINSLSSTIATMTTTTAQLREEIKHLTEELRSTKKLLESNLHKPSSKKPTDPHQ